MIQIWKDTYYEYMGDSLIYTIEMYDEELNEWVSIFNGKAVANPREASIKININKIVKDYLSCSLPDIRTFRGSYFDVTAIRKFKLINGNGTILENYTFIYDWSYGDSIGNTLSKPINDKLGAGQLTFNTVIVGETIKTTIEESEGNTCKGDYAIYYLNRYGGWDSFLIENNVIKKDVYNKYYTDKVVDNNTLAFAKSSYLNTITTSYELHTGWLKDEQAKNLAFNMLSSNKAYLHNLIENKIEPILFTDAEAIYKTFKNQGNKLYSYTINVECSKKQSNL